MLIHVGNSVCHCSELCAANALFCNIGATFLHGMNYSRLLPKLTSYVRPNLGSPRVRMGSRVSRRQNNHEKRAKAKNLQLQPVIICRDVVVAVLAGMTAV